jgi:hypothetical protein
MVIKGIICSVVLFRVSWCIATKGFRLVINGARLVNEGKEEHCRETV